MSGHRDAIQTVELGTRLAIFERGRWSGGYYSLSRSGPNTGLVQESHLVAGVSKELRY
jgi:hypothetical protein